MSMFSWLLPKTSATPAPPPLRPAPRPTPHGKRSDDRVTTRAVYEDFGAFLPGYADVANPLEQFFDGLRIAFPLFPVRYDRRVSGGSYIVLTDSQLDLIRAFARWSFETNPYSLGAILALRDYSVGRGLKYSATARKHYEVSKQLLKKVDRFLDDFMEPNHWLAVEREAFTRKHRDGDCFLELLPDAANALTTCEFIEPETVRALDKTGQEWAFGVKCRPNHPSVIEAINVWGYPDASVQGRVVPIDYVGFFKNHTDANVKRGLSDFFAVQDGLDDAGKLIKSGRQGEAVRQAIAFVRQFAMASQADVLSLQSSQTSYQIPSYAPSQPGAAGAPARVNVVKTAPGTVEDIPEGMEYQNGPIGNAENCKVMLQETLKACCARWRLPSWFLTGEMSGNYASALVAESPHVKAVECEQELLAHDLCETLMKVVRVGVDQGELPEEVLERVRVEAECPPVATRNRKEEVEINEVLYRNGLLSARTWAARENLDYDQEQEQLRAEPRPQAPADANAANDADKAANGDQAAADYAKQVNRPS